MGVQSISECDDKSAAATPSCVRLTTLDDPATARARIRAGGYVKHTSGLAPEYVQGNVVILPADLAADFLRFCQRNQPCPLLAVWSPVIRCCRPRSRCRLVRTDPRYRVWRTAAGRRAHRHLPPLAPRPATFVPAALVSSRRCPTRALRLIALGRNVAMY
jgi:hypothetical protein